MKNISKKRVAYILYILFVAIFGFYARLWWIHNIPTQQVFDFETYQEIATNIFQHKGHSFGGEPIAFQGMAYPMTLGYLYRWMGSNDIMIAKTFNVVLSTLTYIISFFIFARLTNKLWVLATAFTVVALLPNYIAYTNVVGTEVLSAFLFSVVILLQLYPFDKRLHYPLLGLFIGITALAKPFFMAYPVVAAAALWLREKDVKKTAVYFAALFAVMVLVIAPWTYRNYQKFGRFIPVSYNSGYVFYLNNNENNSTGGWMPIKDMYATEEFRKQVDEILEHGQRSEKLAHELDPLFKAEAKKWILENPGKFLKLGFLRVKGTFFSGAWDIDSWTMNELREKQEWWDKVAFERNKNLFRGFSDMMIHLMSSFGLAYVFFNIKSALISLFNKKTLLGNHLIIPTVNIGFFLAIYFIFEGQARYNFPLLFLLAISAVLCIERIHRGFANTGNTPQV
ncbi:hypothetical protein [Geosporobacter ferrireducens]|uniref:Glycosyltransferase RgtA/B/C/D-like domain-containing protein n=1 Tax=Geosporobacter ferrireducens TaxID=1424294 RepID=A0A1D8GGW8_9FIRM|nr:hypothetical protein [Geosporobacter ferrireducens]AOT70155.1 hypothetical protein Gferi_11460 [Geosporobacter ferrireducens]